jgi:23S rRNA (guanine2445-N2)-methyltransferase / 23S rRNA (guanine2069-N7)-methyltransferase
VKFFATTPKGLELLLVEELRSLGATDPAEKLAGVVFSGDLALAYRACLWSRLANRILLQLAEVTADTPEELYAGVQSIAWDEHIQPDGTLNVNFISSNSKITHTLFGAQKVKDAIVDQLREKYNVRPSVERENPDISVHVYLQRNVASISLDLSGESLHKRGYRLEAGAAPLKENLAAAILMRAGWKKIAENGGMLLDPMCGSGTLLIEAALMSANIAPGLMRDYFGFLRWKKHDAALWEKIVREAHEARTENFARIVGYDADPHAIKVAFANIERAGLLGKVHVEKRELVSLTSSLTTTSITTSRASIPTSRASIPTSRASIPTSRASISTSRASISTSRASISTSRGLSAGSREPNQDHLDPMGKPQDAFLGLVVTNPPYGERLGEIAELKVLYQQLGQKLKSEFVGWEAAVFTSNPDLGKTMGLRSKKSYALFNGALPCQLLLFNVQPEWFVDNSPQANNERRIRKAQKSLSDRDRELAQMFANRLQKNRKHLRRWAEREAISCYRVYDADLPEYAVSVDFYDQYVCVQEYQAPKSVDRNKAQERLQQVLSVLPDTLNVPAANIFLRERDQQGEFLKVEEFKKKFLVDFYDANYPVGLPLEQRTLRALIQSVVKDKLFLHLFSYSGAMTVCAGVGGAKLLKTIAPSEFDLSWSRQNLALNDLQAEVILADCEEWILKERLRYEVIFAELPEKTSFINREYTELLIDMCRLLTAQGTLYFVTYDSRFKLADFVHEQLFIEDITAKLIPNDFTRRSNIFKCLKIHRK